MQSNMDRNAYVCSTSLTNLTRKNCTSKHKTKRYRPMGHISFSDFIPGIKTIKSNISSMEKSWIRKVLLYAAFGENSFVTLVISDPLFGIIIVLFHVVTNVFTTYTMMWQNVSIHSIKCMALRNGAHCSKTFLL